MSLLQSIRAKSARVGVIGLGYVGLPLAVASARCGFPVTGFDVDPEKVAQVNAGESYIEAVAAEAMDEACAAGLKATDDFSGLRECQIIIICVPTPLSAQREPDLSYVEETTTTIAAHLRPGTMVVLESTTYPGTTEEVICPILSTSGFKLGEEIFVAYSPEREDPGNKSFTTRSIPKVVAGSGQLAGDLVEAFYSQVVERVVRVSTTQTAEAVKITENIFRAVNIALVNEMKLIYEAMGIDVWEVIDGAATKPFGFMPFYPGPGLGGHCIPIDPFYLTWKAREFEVPTRFIELAGEINTRMPRHVVDRVRAVIDVECGRGLKGSEILLVGIAYKKNVPDMRESPSMKLMELLDEAEARVAYFDPHVPEIPKMREYMKFASIKSIEPSKLKPNHYTAVIIATDHDDIDYAALTALGCPIIDTRNAISRRGLPGNRVFKA